MASLGHIAVGMAAARIYDRPLAIPSGQSIAWLCVLSMLPDADAIGLSLGIPYAHPFGHRGATHSFVFAALVAILVALVERARGGRPVIAAISAGAVVTTHPLLDTLTNGGLGCALFFSVRQHQVFCAVDSHSGLADWPQLFLVLRPGRGNHGNRLLLAVLPLRAVAFPARRVI